MKKNKAICFDLENKVVIVTGAGQGIGKDIALRLAEEKAVVIIADIDMKNAERAAEEISKRNLKATPIEVNVAKKADVKNMTEFVIAKHEKIDFLVNNAGVRTINLFKDLTEKEWDWVIDVNLKGVFLCSQSVVNYMRKRKNGCIVNISSVLSLGAMRGRAHYCSSKSGVSSLTRVMATELAQYNIRVNAVAPGIIHSPMADENPPDAFQDKHRHLPALLLLSDESEPPGHFLCIQDLQ